MKARIPCSPAPSARSISARQRTDFEASRIGFPPAAAQQVGGVAIEGVEVDNGERRLQSGSRAVQRFAAGALR